MITLPVWCACGKIVTFANENRCEDCYASDQARFSGKSSRVITPNFSAKQEAEMAQRSREVVNAFKGLS